MARSLCRVRLGPVVMIAGCLLASQAHAGLGGGIATVESDRAHLSAHMATVTKSAFSVSAMTLPNGAVAQEFARSDGVVFAVSWRGPSRPDLRQLLGGYFDTFQADTTPTNGRRTHRPLNTNRSDLIVHSGGRPGGFRGYAYLPQLVPAGFTASDLQ